MTLTQKAVDAAVKAMKALEDEATADPENIFGADLTSLAEAALTAALAVDGLCLVPSNILAELRKRDDTINQIGPRGEELTERVIANECANAWPIVSAMLAAASDGGPPREDNKK